MIDLEIFRGSEGVLREGDCGRGGNRRAFGGYRAAEGWYRDSGFRACPRVERSRGGSLSDSKRYCGLHELGIAHALRGIGGTVERAEIRTWRDKVLSTIPVSQLDEKLGTRSVAVHRADLQAMLLQERGESVVQSGLEFISFEQNSTGVRAFFTGGREEHCDVLIGADGLRSAVRAGLLGDGQPRYAGYTAWRAVVMPARDLFPPNVALEYWGTGTRCLCTHVGGGRVYWAVSRNAPEGEKDVAGATKDALLRLHRGWSGPIPALIEATEEPAILRTDIYDRNPPRKRWGEGRVTLLGDAAHPMTPDLGQGACQAIEDAVELARCLGYQETGVAAALGLYEARRIRRTAWIVRGSRRTGRIAQLQNPLACRLRNAALRALPLRLQMKQLEALMGTKSSKYADPSSVGDKP
jgi:2-polyprenyl-6-methoxyphenol hydroxylase-like FAD-dependent oxidoreductase